MPFSQDTAIVEEVGDEYGRYVATYVSATGQATAHLFDVEGDLIAHISFARGLDIGTATDRYLSELKQFAQQNGYGDRFRMIFAEQSAWAL